MLHSYLRDGDAAAVEAYERRDRVHGHVDEQAAIEAVVDAAFVGIVDGRDVLVMASTNRVVEQINETMTDRLLATGFLDAAEEIDIAGHRFYAGQPAVTRANDRRLTHGPDDAQWVRNGDRWTVLAGTKDELYLEHRGTRDRQALPAEYVEAGHLRVDYASTIHRAQGATVEDAHLILSEHTDAKQLHVGATRGRNANHIRAHPAAFDAEHHGPSLPAAEWSPTDAVIGSPNVKAPEPQRSLGADNFATRWPKDDCMTPPVRRGRQSSGWRLSESHAPTRVEACDPGRGK